jgi:hypothetical protein
LGSVAAATVPEQNGAERKGPDIFVLALLSIAFVVSSLMAATFFMRARAPERDGSKSCMQFRRRRRSKHYQDAAEQVNLAPRRETAMRSKRVLSSWSDPMTAGLTLPPDEEPEVYIGPPRDEDGNELHNVEIV